MTRRTFDLLPRWLTRTGQLGLLAGLAYLLWHSVDLPQALAYLGGADLQLLLGAALLLSVQTLLSALRWRLTASRLGIILPLGQAIREYYLSQVVNQSLPGGVLGDAGRAVRARGQAGLLASGQAVVFERIAGQIGLLAVLLVALALNAARADGITWPAGVTTALWVALAAAMVGAALALFFRQNAIGRGLSLFQDAVLARPVFPQHAALSLATALCNIAGFALCAAAIGAPLSILAAATLIPMILFAMVLPLSISGWGLREGAAAVLFPVAGLSASAGLAASVAFGLTFLAVTLPGLLMLRRGPDFAT
ncbi:lysylphosphatidylglycerol synthase transmembrane domain-containing protein [Gymnodinialimonas ulvae]|uniref:lysylphosphatidylglycerol synthase transmembrane domain-containing protein n=1 Tax=Gymnodinialimonas ulvae TaxID=3126504 RepID=UPI0030B34756